MFKISTWKFSYNLQADPRKALKVQTKVHLVQLSISLNGQPKVFDSQADLHEGFPFMKVSPKTVSPPLPFA